MQTGFCAPPATGTANGNAIAEKTASPNGLTKYSKANALVGDQGSMLRQ